MSFSDRMKKRKYKKIIQNYLNNKRENKNRVLDRYST